MHRHRRISWMWAAVCVSLTFSACGSPTQQHITRVVATGQFQNLTSSDNGTTHLDQALYVTPFSAPVLGDIAVGLHWTSNSDTVVPVLFQGNCTNNQILSGHCNAITGFCTTAQLILGTCIVNAGSALGSGVAVTVAPGTYTLALLNLGPKAESGTYVVTESSNPGPSAY
jgi:hypothetical protein